MKRSFILPNSNGDSNPPTALFCTLDDNSSVPSVEEASGSSSCKTKCTKNCSFNLDANISHEIEHLDDVPNEENEIRWYSEQEMQAIKTELVSLFRRIKRKEVDPHNLDETTETLRGLEDRYCKEKRTQQKARKAGAKYTVMAHQEQFASSEARRNQCEEELESQCKVIAISYTLASNETKILALELGRMDALVAEQIHTPPEKAKSSLKTRKLGSALRRSLPKQLRKLSNSITSVSSKNTV